MALHRADGWELLCEAPCTLELAPGEHRLALSLDGREPVPAAPLNLQREGTLIGRYVDREDQRTAGWITIAAGVIAAASAAIYSQLQWNDVTGFPDDQLGTIAAVLISGASILVITEIVGWILVAQGDGAELSFD